MSSFKVPVRSIRRIPDPIFPHCERHLLTCAIGDVPMGLPTDPNPRVPNPDRPIYRRVLKHLLNEEGTPNTFHLKNKGITLIAEQVKKIDDNNVELIFEQGQGIVDGRHTYELIGEALKIIADGERSADDNGDAIAQFVKLEVLTGLVPELYPEIAGGLNTAVQVQEASLMHLQKQFSWIENDLRCKPYAREIAYREGEDAEYDIREIVGLLDLFNIFDFPNDQSEHPIRAYTSKAQALTSYRHKPEQYERLRPILKDILTLHDTIALEGPVKHTAAGGRGGKLAFVETRKRGKYTFHFIDKESDRRLFDGALYPMLAAFRWMVEIDAKTGKVGWRGGFANVLKLWDSVGAELMKATQNTSDELGRKPHAIGRSRNHWANLHKTVATADLMRRTA
ncbi:MAG TPA: AIPR family protein [Candidatus Binataceae bacterium]|nr:AIPR family protein [Candidatus Binataceae bacterium]